ncbi:HAD superfamily hydrolase (TIGR01458 family) [Parvibaculum sp. MBR-TMA-1.3b-4.2]
MLRANAMTPKSISEARAALLDISGVLYEGDTALSGAADALARLRQAGFPFRLITNTSRSPKRAILDKLTRLGFEVHADEVVTTASVACAAMKADGAKPYLLVHPDLLEDLPDEAAEPDAVLLGDAAQHFTYERLNAAFRILLEGGKFYALGKNRYFKGTSGLELDAGPFVAALEYASGAEARLIGKPSPDYFREAAKDIDADPATTLMVGDDVEADVLGAIEAGFMAALVKEGKFRHGDDETAKKGGAYVAASLEEIVEALLG